MSTTPRLFISYSWSSPAHQAWVVELAEDLVNSGVDVVLDQWALREGHDAIAFMESMVSDASISKVLIVSDRVYAEKATGRAGGVGTETQIISPEIYAKQTQDKFVVVVAEHDEHGKPYLPIYYKSRMYIDLSHPDRYADGFEQLLRCIYGKPRHTRPPLGTPPAFITDPDAPQLGTSGLAKRVEEGFRSDRAYARGALDEYLSTFATQMERFRVDAGGPGGEHLIPTSIEHFLPYRNEFIRVVTTLTHYGDAHAHAQRLHRFFEAVLALMHRPEHMQQHTDIDFDNFKFVIHELFLYTLAIQLRAEQFDAACVLLAEPYYFERSERHISGSYRDFRQYLKSLEIINQQAKVRRVSPHADLLDLRAKSSGVEFRHLMQADFICYMRAELTDTSGGYDRWFPETLLSARRVYGPFEIFARAASKAYLARVLPLLGGVSFDAIHAKLDFLRQNPGRVPRWESTTLAPQILMGAERLGSLP